MSSVAHQCEQCGKIEGETHETGKVVRFRLNGSGEPRPKCLPCENVYTANWRQWRTALVPIQQYDAVPVHTGTARGALVRVESEQWHMVSVADVCEVFGIQAPSQIVRLKNDPNYAPYLRKGSDINGQSGSQEMWLLRYDKVPGWLHLINPNKVRADRYSGLVAYRDVADKVLSDYFLGTKQAPPSPAAAQQTSLWQPDVEHGVRTVVREEVRAALAEENERLESRTLRGKDVYIDRPVDGRVYIAEEDRRVLLASISVEVLRRLDRGWRYLFISQSGRGEDERLQEYTKKRAAGVPAPVLRKVILSDARRKLEPALHKSLPEGVWKVPNKQDEFMASPEAYDRLMELPGYIGSIDIPRLKYWMLCQSIFETV